MLTDGFDQEVSTNTSARRHFHKRQTLLISDCVLLIMTDGSPVSQRSLGPPVSVVYLKGAVIVTRIIYLHCYPVSN